MDSLIKTLHGFTDHLGSFQTVIQNLKEVIPTVIDSAKQLSKELSQLPSTDVLTKIHEPPKLTTHNNQGREDEELAETKLALAKTQDYDSRGKINYASKPLEIGEGYQFNHGLFKDNLNSSYIKFISSIDKEFTARPREQLGTKEAEEQLQKAIEAVKSPFTSWLNNFNSVHNSTNGAIPIENIQKDYKIPFRLMSKEQINEIKQKEDLAAQSSLMWLRLAQKSIRLLDKMATGRYKAGGTLSQIGAYQIGELIKFLLQEMEEKFSSENTEKLISLCKKNKKTLKLGDGDISSILESLKNFDPHDYAWRVSDLGLNPDTNQGLNLNQGNIDYIAGFFQTETKNQKVNIQHLCATLYNVHKAYIEEYPSEGNIGNEGRHKIASEISNIVQLLKKESLSEEQKSFINSLETFYTIEKENTKNL